MSTVTETPFSGTTSNSDFKKADGFLNLVFKHPNGEEYAVTKGSALHKGIAIDDFLLSLLESNPGVVLEFSGTVNSATKKVDVIPPL